MRNTLKIAPLLSCMFAGLLAVPAMADDTAGLRKSGEVDTGKRIQKFTRYGENGCSGTGPAVVGGEAAERQ